MNQFSKMMQKLKRVNSGWTNFRRISRISNIFEVISEIEKLIYENREIVDDFEHSSGVKIELEGA